MSLLSSERVARMGFSREADICPKTSIKPTPILLRSTDVSYHQTIHTATCPPLTSPDGAARGPRS